MDTINFRLLKWLDEGYMTRPNLKMLKYVNNSAFVSARAARRFS